MILLIFFLILPLTTIAQEEWQLHKQKNEITVSWRNLPKKAGREIKTQMTLQANPKALEALIRDDKNATQWIDRVIKFENIHELSPSEWHSYSEIEIPFPFANKDLVTHNRVEYDSQTGATKIYLKAVPDLIPRKDGISRIIKMQAVWEFLPINLTTTKVTYIISAQTESILPAWLTTPIVSDGMYMSFLKMKERIASYQK